MPKTVTTYYIDELEGHARQHARDSIRERYADAVDYWPDEILGNFRTEMEEWGFLTPIVSWGKLFCQGGGASFESKEIDWNLFVTKEKARVRFRALLNQLNSGNLELDYELTNHACGNTYHKMNMQVRYEYHWRDHVPAGYIEDRLAGLMDELEKYILEVARDHSEKLFWQLRDEELDVYKDDNIDQWAKKIEITFDHMGHPFYPEEDEEDDYDTSD